MSCFVFTGHSALSTDRPTRTCLGYYSLVPVCTVHVQLQQRYSVAVSGFMEMTNGNGIASMQRKRSDDCNTVSTARDREWRVARVLYPDRLSAALS